MRIRKAVTDKQSFRRNKMDIMDIVRSLPGGVAQGLMWAVLALGVYVTYKILDFADLTVDGSLATGGAIAIVSIAAGVPALLAMLFAFIAGALAGAITATLNTKLKIPAILSGILTMSALYSVNIRILNEKPNVSIPSDASTYNGIFAQLFSLSVIDDKNLLTIISCSIALAALIAVMYWFFGTEIGSAVRATGCNEKMAKAQGINTDATKYIALMASNGLAALAGALIAQYGFSADVNMASGTIVIGLASVIIGELIIGNRFSFWVKLLGVVLGSVIYRLIFAVAIGLGMKSTDLKLVASVITAIALCVPMIKSKFAGRKKHA